MASSIWLAQPPSEQSRLNKICAGCEVESASLACGRCHCTRYCQKECQRKHWKQHKRPCQPDPIYSLKEDSCPLPVYRIYTSEELGKMNKAYILETGEVKGKAVDERDRLCKLISPADEATLDAMFSSHCKQRGRMLVDRLGWTSVGTNPVMGYSCEDSVMYRLFFDDSYQIKSDLPENLIAKTLIQSEVHRGRFVVVKEPGGPNEDLVKIPFSKS